MFSSRSISWTTRSSELKLLSLHPYLAFTLTRLNIAQGILAPRIQRLLWINFQCIIHRGMCLLKRLLSKIMNHILQAISHLYIKRFRLGPTLHVCQFTLPYPYCIILLNPNSQQMLQYVIEYFLSPVQTIYAWTKKISRFHSVDFFLKQIVGTVPHLLHTQGSSDFHSSNFEPSK